MHVLLFIFYNLIRFFCQTVKLSLNHTSHCTLQYYQIEALSTKKKVYLTNDIMNPYSPVNQHLSYFSFIPCIKTPLSVSVFLSSVSLPSFSPARNCHTPAPERVVLSVKLAVATVALCWVSGNGPFGGMAVC